jgi:hypothetical protein
MTKFVPFLQVIKARTEMPGPLAQNQINHKICTLIAANVPCFLTMFQCLIN